jgi:hypothetical protein
MSMNDIAVIKNNDRTQDLLKELDTLKRRLEEGEIIDFALAFVLNTRKVGTAWSRTEDKWRLVGAIENLKHELIEGEHGN